MAVHSKQHFVPRYLDLGQALGAGVINMVFNDAHTLCFLQCHGLAPSKKELSGLVVVTDQALGYSWLFPLCENSLVLQQISRCDSAAVQSQEGKNRKRGLIPEIRAC